MSNLESGKQMTVDEMREAVASAIDYVMERPPKDVDDDARTALYEMGKWWLEQEDKLESTGVEHRKLEREFNQHMFAFAVATMETVNTPIGKLTRSSDQRVLRAARDHVDREMKRTEPLDDYAKLLLARTVLDKWTVPGYEHHLYGRTSVSYATLYRSVASQVVNASERFVVDVVDVARVREAEKRGRESHQRDRELR